MEQLVSSRPLHLVALKGAWVAAGLVITLVSGVGTWAFMQTDDSKATITASAPSSTGTTSSNGGGNVSGTSDNGNGPTGKDAKVTFTVSGAVVPAPGLKLGAPNTLPVTVTNPSTNKNKEVLTVTSITVTSAGPGCDATNLTVGSYDASAPGATPYVLTVGTSKVIPIPILLVDKLNADQTPCLGKTFPLTVNGLAGVTK
jgi:hypothetical protein